MGRLLDRLLSDSQQSPAAIPAIPAILAPVSGVKIAESQESQRAHVEKTMRDRLLALAADEYLDAELVHGLGTDDVIACERLPDETLRAYLWGLERNAGMDAGIVPAEWRAVAHCEGCGPVHLWEPLRVIACPWCRVRKAGKYMPRPMVRCGDCRHHVPDGVNPPGGCGACGLGLPYRSGERARYPSAERYCAEYRPTLSTLDAGILHPHHSSP